MVRCTWTNWATAKGGFWGGSQVDARIDQDGIGHEKKSTRNAAGKTEKKAPQKVRWSPEKKKVEGTERLTGVEVRERCSTRRARESCTGGKGRNAIKLLGKSR